MTTRNQVYRALLALTAPYVGDSPRLLRSASRKFKHYDRVSKDLQPALFQSEPSEAVTHQTSMPYRWVWRAWWTVYFPSDPENDSDLPADLSNDLLDMMESALAPKPYEEKQTLAGLVFDVAIDGEVMKVNGDDDGQGLLAVPIRLLIP